MSTCADAKRRQPSAVRRHVETRALPFPFFLDACSPSERKTGGHALFYGKPSIPPLSSSTFEEQARDTVASRYFHVRHIPSHELYSKGVATFLLRTL